LPTRNQKIASRYKAAETNAGINADGYEPSSNSGKMLTFSAVLGGAFFGIPWCIGYQGIFEKAGFPCG
jgi:hypothetical protein